jgi:hypothetical protein
MCMAPHCEQVANVGLDTFQCALRRRVRDRDIFFFGTAIRGTSFTSSILGREMVAQYGEW